MELADLGHLIRKSDSFPAMPTKKLVGTKCYLSPANMGSVEYYNKWDNDLEVAIPLGGEACMITTVESLQADLQSVIKSKSHLYDIITLDSDVPIGRCLFFNTNKVDRTAEVGIVIGEKEYWDQGYGTEALQLLLEYGFNLLNLHNITLGVYSYNKRAQASYQKLGFKEIGRRREARIIAGKKYDVILMDIISSEFTTIYLKDILDALE